MSKIEVRLSQANIEEAKLTKVTVMVFCKEAEKMYTTFVIYFDGTEVIFTKEIKV